MDIKKLNNKLIRIYGHCNITDKPKYRVVRSEDQNEKRTGDYNTFYGDIFLRRERGTRLIKKYWYLPPCWILERVEPNLDRTNLIAEKFTYEPLFPFLDPDNKPVPLNWRAIELLLNTLQNAERKVRSEEEDRLLEEKRMKSEEERVYGILDAPDPIKELPTFKSSSLLNDTKNWKKTGSLYVPQS